MESFAYYWQVFLNLQAREFQTFVSMAGDFSSYVAWVWWGIPQIILGLHVAEHLRPARPQQRKWRPGLGLDLFWLFFSGVIVWYLFAHAVVQTLLLVFRHAAYQVTGVTDLRLVSLEDAPVWLGLTASFLAADLVGWAGHWLIHRVDFLWKFHKVHHSTTQLDALNAQRFHFGESIYFQLFNFFPLALVGFPPDKLLIATVISAILSNFSHANIKVPLGPLRYVINNPEVHSWHHARAVDAKRNVNYGDALVIWDYLFGTFYLPKGVQYPELGFDDVESYPTSIPGQLLAPFVDIGRSWLGWLRPRASGS